MFLLVVIGIFLIVPMSEERTLILTTPSNSTGGCSDLDCLNDVTLIDLINNQILVYNSTSGDWENTNQTSFVDTTICNNLGSGKIICPSYSSGNINLRTLKASTGLSIANDTTSITYTNTLPESTVCSGQSGNYNIVASSSGGNCTFKNLVPSTGISISSNSTHITISNSGVTSITANSPLSASSSTGSVTLSCSTCVTTSTNTWTLLCQQTGNGATTVTCSSFTAKKHLYVTWITTVGTSAGEMDIRFNSDTGANYANRSVKDGTASSSTGQTACLPNHTNTYAVNDQPTFVFWIDNDQSGNRKIARGIIGYGADSSSATAPSWVEWSCKWDNTSAQITTIQFLRSSTEVFNNAVLTVWGYD